MPSDSAISLMQASRPIIKEISKILQICLTQYFWDEGGGVEDLTQ